MTSRAAVAIGVAGLIGGSLWLLEPHVDRKDESWFRQQQQQQQVENLSDSQENSDSRKRNAGTEHADAENSRRNVPGERRPPEPLKPRVKIRIFP